MLSSNKKILLLACSIAVLLLVIYIVALNCYKKTDSVQPEPMPVACTMEAKICADGSAVGRGGPKCEFAPCPEPLNNPAWLSSTNEAGVSFQYPEKLGTEYISAQDWPATLSIADKVFECLETGDETKAEGQTTKKMLGEKSYCITKQSEGAAGSIYTTYTYAFAFGARTASFNFVLRSVQCANYDEPKKTACETERNTFDLDALVDKMARSLQIK